MLVVPSCEKLGQEQGDTEATVMQESEVHRMDYNKRPRCAETLRAFPAWNVLLASPEVSFVCL